LKEKELGGELCTGILSYKKKQTGGKIVSKRGTAGKEEETSRVILSFVKGKKDRGFSRGRNVRWAEVNGVSSLSIGGTLRQNYK